MSDFVDIVVLLERLRLQRVQLQSERVVNANQLLHEREHRRDLALRHLDAPQTAYEDLFTTGRQSMVGCS